MPVSPSRARPLFPDNATTPRGAARRSCAHQFILPPRPPEQEEQELSAANSALVNAGYQTLRHPLERVKYLLSLHGIEVLAETAGTISDPTLLMEVMEIRDEISTCTSGAALRKMTDANAARLEALMEALERHYGAGDYGAIGDSAIELQYFSKIEEEISLRADVVG